MLLFGNPPVLEAVIFFADSPVFPLYVSVSTFFDVMMMAFIAEEEPGEEDKGSGEITVF